MAYLKDPIYIDIENQIKIFEAQLAADGKAVQEARDELKISPPRSSRLKFAQKRLSESLKKYELTHQQLRYYKFRRESRQAEAQSTYLKSLQTGQPWPDTREYEIYKMTKEGRDKSRAWNVKHRIEIEKQNDSLDPAVTSGSGPPKQGGH